MSLFLIVNNSICNYLINRSSLYFGNGKISSKAQANSPRENITVGQNVIVQIIKDEVGTKGPRATMHLSIPGRHVVLMPNSAYIGTSHRIEDEEERKRLHDIVRAEVPENMGCIIRTAAQGQSEENIVKQYVPFYHSKYVRLFGLGNLLTCIYFFTKLR